MPSIDDEAALNTLAIASDAFWVSGTVQISTVEGQQPLGPGRIANTWSQEGRNYVAYVIDSPSPFNWCLGTFDTRRKSVQLDALQLSIWYSPKHPFNLSIYEKAVETSLHFIEDKLGSFPYETLRLVEIPHYQEPFYAFSNTIAISEEEGWYADTTELAARAYLYHTVASQLVKLWLQKQVKVADVQGAEMLQKALPEAMALEAVRITLGEKAVDHLLEKKKEMYYKQRGNDPNTEQPLLYADGAEYLAQNKGVIALHDLANTLGFEVFVKVLMEWITIQGEDYATFKSFYDRLYSTSEPKERKVVKETFEEVI